MLMIAWTIYLTFAGAIAALLLPRWLARWIALATSLGGFVLGLAAFFARGADFGRSATIVRVPWVPALGMNYHLAADGISLTMMLVTGLDRRLRSPFFLENRATGERILLLAAARRGRLLRRLPERGSVSFFRFLRARDRAEILPHRDLGIDQQGIRRDEIDALFVPRRRAGFHRNFGGLHHARDRSIFSFSRAFHLRRSCKRWAFPILFLGFAILAGIWPLHTWAPTGHVAAPTAGSMLLAGIVMKLGAYGALRVALNLFPLGFVMWREWIVVLAVIGIIWAAAVALRQNDLKFVIGYSSVSHMGFVLLGLAAANSLGASGAVLQMFSHGVIGALLFALAGVVYRAHAHAEPERAFVARFESRAAVCRVRVCRRLGGFDGDSGFQRVRGGNHDPARSVAGVSLGGGWCRSRHGVGRRFYFAGLEARVLCR